ncbi:hypothetical+protein [Methylocapsa aurea]|uniref:DUF2312 domain-containing protein n=1 Tax=Methylocapsa aurea TaxID=663610 RepID=UPI003D189125
MGARIQNTVDAAILLGFVERYENLEAEKKEIGEDEKVVLAEARVAGLDPKVLKHCVKVRKQKPADYHEARALADMYLSALGLVEPPLFRAANLIDVDILARGSVVEAMKRFVPEHGSITIDAGAGAPLRLTRGLDGEVTVEDVVPDRDERGGPEPASGEASRGRGSRKARREAALPPPDVDPEVAEALGISAARDNVPIILNPFPFGDARRARWDLGWRKGAGNDGMGPQ